MGGGGHPRAGSAAHRASRGESGDHATYRTVFISLPGDILDAEAPLDMGNPTRVQTDVRPSDAALERLAGRLLAASNPVLIAGHELATRDALKKRRNSPKSGAPVYQQTVATLPTSRPSIRLPRCAHPQPATGAFRTLPSRPAGVPGRRRAAHVGAQSGGSAARGHAGGADRRARLGAGQELPGRDRHRRCAGKRCGRCCRSCAQNEPRRKAQSAQRLAEFAKNNWSAKRERLAKDMLAVAAVKPMDPRWLMMTIADALPKMRWWSRKA